MHDTNDTRRADFDALLPAHSPSHVSSRRGFMGSTLAVGFALATQPISAGTVVSTPADGLVQGDASLDVANAALPVYYARPDSGEKWPVVLVVQEVFGVHEHIRDICRRLARLGYFAVAPELYVRHGDPRHYDSIPELLTHIVSKVPDTEVLHDLDACAAWAGTQGADATRLGITGFCWGGRIAWLYAAHAPQLKAAVAWYGRLTGESGALTPRHPLDVVAQLHAPVLGLYGGQDQGIPLADVEQMRTALAAAGRTDCEIVVYPDAPHAFHADYRPSYRAREAADGWQRMAQWFERHL